VRAFAARVKVEVRKKLSELRAEAPAAGARHVGPSRKAYLQARSEAKRRRKLGLPATDGEGGGGGGGAKRPRYEEAAARADVPDFPAAESIRFGERAERPPKLVAGPVKSKKRREAEAAFFAAQRAGAAAAAAAADGEAAGGDGDDDDGGERARAIAARAARAIAVRELDKARLRAASYAALGKRPRSVIGAAPL
jgi:hypothetical protein